MVQSLVSSTLTGMEQLVVLLVVLKLASLAFSRLIFLLSHEHSTCNDTLSPLYAMMQTILHLLTQDSYLVD